MKVAPKKERNIIRSPIYLALLYAVLASGSSIGVAHYQGLLLVVPTEFGSLSSGSILPLIKNVSTLLDFTLLNPLAIFFLLLTLHRIQIAAQALSISPLVPLYHNLGALFVSVALSIVSMNFYVQSFLEGNYYDANILPSSSGPYVTATGWVVFFWTAVYIAFLYYGVLIYSWFVVKILSLNRDDIIYQPFHYDESGGLRYLFEPTLSFLYAMMVLLITFIVFGVHDLNYSIKESNRLLGFIVYLIVSVPLFFIPLLHINSIMRKKRTEYINTVHTLSKDVLKSIHHSASLFYESSSDSSQRLVCFQQLEAIVRYYRIARSFPVWPLPQKKLVLPFGSFIGAFTPILIKSISPILFRWFD